MFFDLVKKINKLKKEINGSLSKGISNIYLSYYIEEKNDVLKTSVF